MFTPTKATWLTYAVFCFVLFCLPNFSWHHTFAILCNSFSFCSVTKLQFLHRAFLSNIHFHFIWLPECTFIQRIIFCTHAINANIFNYYMRRGFACVCEIGPILVDAPTKVAIAPNCAVQFHLSRCQCCKKSCFFCDENRIWYYYTQVISITLERISLYFLFCAVKIAFFGVHLYKIF